MFYLKVKSLPRRKHFSYRLQRSIILRHVYVDINILGESVNTIKKNAEQFVVASKVNGLELNVDKTKYMVMYGDQNARRRHTIKIDNRSFERVEEFKYLGRALTNRNFL